MLKYFSPHYCCEAAVLKLPLYLLPIKTIQKVIFVMFSSNTKGKMLPAYVIYKSERLWGT